MRQVLIIIIWQLSAIYFLASSLQALSGWMVADAHFQVSPEIFDCIQSQAVAGPLKNIHRVSISHSCSVLRVIVLLEGKPSARLRFWMLWTGFWLRRSQYFGALSFSSTLMSPSVPAADKQPHSMRLLPANFTFWMVICRWWAELVSFKHDAWNWGSSDQRISFLRVWGSFRCFPSVFSCVFTEERIASGHTSIKPKSVECCSDVCPSVDISHLHIWSWSSTRVTIRFLVTSLTKALLHQLLSLARRPALERVLVVSNFFH